MGWDHNYNKRLVELYSEDIIYYDGTGRRERFKVNGQPGTYQAPNGWFAELVRSEDGNFRLVYSEGIIETFDSLGRLINIQDRNQNKMEFYYNVSGQLSAVMDAMGRLINFKYINYSFEEISNSGKVKPDHGRLSRIIDFSGREVIFTYDLTSGDLDKVEITTKNPFDTLESRTVSYNYNLELSHNIETITDAKGQTALTVSMMEKIKLPVGNKPSESDNNTHLQQFSEINPAYFYSTTLSPLYILLVLDQRLYYHMNDLCATTKIYLPTCFT